MVAVERVNEYAKLSPEDDQGRNKNLPQDWPQNGEISAENVSFRYHNTLPRVLDKIHFKINSNEKVKAFSRGKIVARKKLYYLKILFFSVLFSNCDIFLHEKVGIKSTSLWQNKSQANS